MSTSRSTGPRSAEGKAVSRLNALKTGIYAKAQVILPDEDPFQLEDLTSEYYQRFAPATPEQRRLVDSLVSDEWLLRRFRTIEAQLMSHVVRHAPKLDERSVLAEAYNGCFDKLNVLQRRISAVRRSYEKSLALLNQLQASAARAPQPDPQPVQSDTAVTRFVPPNRPTASDLPAAAPQKPAAVAPYPPPVGLSIEISPNQ